MARLSAVSITLLLLACSAAPPTRHAQQVSAQSGLRRLVIVGNHEFDFGLPVLLERMKQARYPMLAANVFRKGTRERPEWATASALLDVRGLKVGVIGLATMDTPTVTNPLNVTDLDFVPGGPV